MNVFDIHFINSGKDIPSGECTYGEIQIDGFCERFISDLTFWSKPKYEQQWLEAISQLAACAQSALIISLPDPAIANIVRWWAMYREGDLVVFQEQLCFVNEFREPFEPEKLGRFLRARETISDEGYPISEWTTTVAAVYAFHDQQLTIQKD